MNLSNVTLTFFSKFKISITLELYYLYNFLGEQRSCNRNKDTKWKFFISSNEFYLVITSSPLYFKLLYEYKQRNNGVSTFSFSIYNLWHAMYTYSSLQHVAYHQVTRIFIIEKDEPTKLDIYSTNNLFTPFHCSFSI